ncbi:hypothetical protein [Streptomyces xanthochromogenes]|uniref:hypothetical protein n=1 Tax=Streptomyces xanthochromogenes TaxID=67384 RepID=UPI0034207AEB
MTDEKPQSPAPLTDKQRATQQVGITDMTTGAAQALSGMFPFGGRVRFFGKTDFEGHRLNEMIDLIHPANPQHLISAGDALFAAHEAISSAAAELRGHIGKVEWEGESGEAFRTWGNNLANHANRLAEFADTAGVQISAAGQGLVSVKSAMPPRDHRAEPVKVDDLPTAKRVAGNAEYEAALKVEQDRQEAINQMNRLSSFYSVSEQTLAAQEPPVFEPMPKVGVPQPLPNTGDPVMPVRTTETGASTRPNPAGGGGGFPHHAATEVAAQHAYPEVKAAPQQQPTGGSPASPGHPHDRHNGMELNSAITLPVQPEGQAATSPPAPSVVGPASGPVLPMTGGSWNQTTRGTARAAKTVTGSGPAQPQAGGRQVAPGAGVRGPALHPEGRPGDSTQGVGRAGAPAVGQSPMGRGVSGGTPGTGGPSATRSGPTGRGGGIVGGRPNVAAPNPAASRMSKGAVVGAEGTAGSVRAAGGSVQRGVVGANKPGGAQKGRPAPGNPDGVLGVPKGRSSGARSWRGRFTKGGEGLVRERTSESECDDSDDEELPQQDYRLVEGDEGSGAGRPTRTSPAIDQEQART